MAATHSFCRKPARPASSAAIFNALRNGAAIKDLGRLFDYRSSSRTFPARRPALQLDRIFAAGIGDCIEEGILRDDRFREASDHLPVFARFEIGG
jgi:endonuclease/exonuclease/phosphatase family metal-dependent hydrolase